MSYSYSPQQLLQSYEALQLEASFQNDTPNSSSSSSSVPPRTGTSFRVAAIQITSAGLPHNNVQGFWTMAQQAVENAASQGNHLILLPELFLGPYFCQSQEASLMGLAAPLTEDHFIIRRMRELAAQYQVVLPISLYERKNNALYNSVVMIDADGTLLGTYRKSHIPDGTGYQEKFYFTPGDTGFKVFHTKVGVVGVLICWDQWFPEAARAMALQGADVLLYPTAIGSEPQDTSLNSADHWQRAMQGHAASNMIPVVASNRIGTEILLHENGTEKQRINFYGRSFITDETGAILQEVQGEQEEPFVILSAEIDPAKNRSKRCAWGLFRDRRPELYGILQTKDGST